MVWWRNCFPALGSAAGDLVSVLMSYDPVNTVLNAQVILGLWMAAPHLKATILLYPASPFHKCLFLWIHPNKPAWFVSLRVWRFLWEPENVSPACKIVVKLMKVLYSHVTSRLTVVYSSAAIYGRAGRAVNLSALERQKRLWKEKGMERCRTCARWLSIK